MAKAVKRAPAKAKAGGASKSRSKPSKPAKKSKIKGGSSNKRVAKSKPVNKKPRGKTVAGKAAVKPSMAKTSKSSAPEVQKKIVVAAAKGEKSSAKAVVAPPKVAVKAKATAVPVVAQKPILAQKSAGAKKGMVNGVATKLQKAAKPEKAHRSARPIPFTPPLINESRTAAPVPTDSKPRKNQAGFTARELEHFRDLLLAKRGEIVGDMSAMEREALRTSGGSNLSTLPIHMADIGTDNYEQEFTLGLVETERKLLREINNALAKIQNGAYGICEGTGKPISKERLEVQPWARYSIEFAKQMERMGKGYQI